MKGKKKCPHCGGMFMIHGLHPHMRFCKQRNASSRRKNEVIDGIVVDEPFEPHHNSDRLQNFDPILNMWWQLLSSEQKLCVMAHSAPLIKGA